MKPPGSVEVAINRNPTHYSTFILPHALPVVDLGTSRPTRCDIAHTDHGASAGRGSVGLGPLLCCIFQASIVGIGPWGEVSRSSGQVVKPWGLRHSSLGANPKGALRHARSPGVSEKNSFVRGSRPRRPLPNS